MLKSKLYWKTYAISDLTESMIRSMYSLYENYYEQTSFDIFAADLKQKTEVIVLFDRDMGRLQGFSTLVSFMLKQNGKDIPCVFSGDTIIHERFWGQRSLGVAFLIYMFKKKMRHPTVPLYWYLISKGYKTYLLMANNFKEHYPRFERSTPEPMAALIEQASERLFPGCYQEIGTLVFPLEKAARLKLGVADIDTRLLSHPRIKFFNETNPGWKEGEELACLAEMSLMMPFHYYHKSMMKLCSAEAFKRPLKSIRRKAVNEAVN
ncbi:MAG: hypothetical protein EOP07_08545 [Proteobacteria bacterium]|nr:MAG: hypothetical protein EOP07_08545 [Pseudomonadota bacterium]